MAKESTVGYLPGNTPEAQQANLEYQQALLRMQEALDARKNRFFDPELLALAQGFLAPTQTGGWGESLGYGLKNYREAVAQQEKEERDIAQAQLGLAGRGLEMERLRGQERLREKMFGPRTGALSTGEMPGQPTGKEPIGPLSSQSAPPGFNVSMGVPTMPPNPDILNRRDQYILAANSKGIDPVEMVKDLAKIDEQRFLKTEFGTQDLGTGLMYYSSTELKPKQVFVSPTQTQTLEVTPAQAAQLDNLLRNKDPAYYDYVNTLKSAPPSTRAKIDSQTATPGIKKDEVSEGKDGQPTTLKSPEELAQEANYRKERGTLSAKEQSDEAKAWYARGNDASSLLNDIRVIQGIFSPQNKYSKVLSGVFEKGDIQSQVGKLLEGGILGDALKEKAREIATNAGLPPMAVTQFQMAVSRMADLKLKASRIMEGQGSVTEPERRLIAESVINITDTPMTVLAKADYLAARARFEDTRARMLRDFRDDKRDYNDFVRSKDYQKLKKDYEQELEGIVERRLGIKMPSREQAGRDNESARNRLPASVR